MSAKNPSKNPSTTQCAIRARDWRVQKKRRKTHKKEENQRRNAENLVKEINY